MPSDESVSADSSLDGASEVDIYDDVDDLGLNRLFIERPERSDLNSNDETNNGTDMESSRLFDEMGSSGGNDNLGEENCKY